MLDSNTPITAKAQQEFVCIWFLTLTFSGIISLKSYSDGIDAFNNSCVLNILFIFFKYVLLSTSSSILYFLGSIVLFLSSSLKFNHSLYSSEYSPNSNLTCKSSFAYTISKENIVIIIVKILNNFIIFLLILH